MVLHNAIYALFRESFGPEGDEPFFFLLAMVVLPLYLVVSLIYSAMRTGVWLFGRSE